MDAIPRGADLPILALFRSRVEKSRVPNQWHYDGAPIDKVDRQGVLCKAYVSLTNCSMRRSSTGLNPRLRAKTIGFNQNFAD
jgi:hypothetical protein